MTELVDTDRASAILAPQLPPPLHDAETRPAPSIAGLMIAGNEADVIARALASLAPVVDELVVVDDESGDGTAEIAREMGAQVLVRRLGADFAAQRNFGLAEVRSDWVIALDADEVLEPGLGSLLRRLVRCPRSDCVFVPRTNRVVDDPGLPLPWPDLQVKAFRSHLRYAGKLHEQVHGWRHPTIMPLSGPSVYHEKDMLRWHQATLRYHEMDPHSPYPPSMVAEARAEVARLERTRNRSVSEG